MKAKSFALLMAALLLLLFIFVKLSVNAKTLKHSFRDTIDFPTAPDSIFIYNPQGKLTQKIWITYVNGCWIAIPDSFNTNGKDKPKFYKLKLK